MEGSFSIMIYKRWLPLSGISDSTPIYEGDRPSTFVQVPIGLISILSDDCGWFWKLSGGQRDNEDENPTVLTG
jgi:hypothetical protein